MKVQVKSAPMGYGKSRDMISTITSEPDNFYFLVLPYLQEVERYKEANEQLPEHNQLIEPCDEGSSKTIDLLNNLNNKTGSIVTTHSMFENLSEDHIRAIKKRPMFRGEKVCVLDETIDLVKPVNSKKLPLEALKADIENGYIVVNETTGHVVWNSLKQFDSDSSYPHHEHLKNLCDTGMLYFIDGRYMIMEVSIDFLEAFDRVVVLTYRWEYSIMANYLKVNGYTYEYLPLDKSKVMESYKYIVDHLVIPDDYSIDEYKLSKRGWSDNTSELKKLFNNTIKDAMVKYDVGIEETLFTTFKTAGGEDLAKWMTTLSIGKWQTKNTANEVIPAAFCAHTTLGTNKFSGCKLMIYGLDKHMMPGVQAYFAQRGVSMPSDMNDLSNLLQWLFRGIIRDRDSDEEMIAIILSPRMRKMAQEWLAWIKRQVDQGELEDTGDSLSAKLTPEVRRKKKQQFNLWVSKDSENRSCFTFDEYLEHGGPALNRRIKEMKKAA
ncbi:hypothetical protein [Halomonas sp. SL1]|uniref:hypothetical protein n=1 Tax=Halomonas sp. SL1 TaxID=2137478 RepID=UPI0011B9381D|nr:hypothetical protein [Halomonas sp. SL1]